MNPTTEAERYFDALWAGAETALRAGDIPPARMENGTTVPLDYCISTVARAAQQQIAPAAPLKALIGRFRDALPDQFFYPELSLHISLLGCTQRHPDKLTFTPERIAAIEAVCRDVLRDREPVPLTLKGAGLVGNQAFIQVYPQTRRWEHLRAALEAAIVALGESPLSHANKAPIHMNFLRLVDNKPETLAAVLALLREMRSQPIGEFHVDTVELFLTDFVIAPAYATKLAAFPLQGMARD